MTTAPPSPAPTNGPWHLTKTSVGTWHVHLEDGSFIAEIGDGPREGDGKTAEANALLIAAAPELLEACKQMLVLFHEEIENDEPISGGDFLEDFLATRPVLLDAIAKAAGC